MALTESYNFPLGTTAPNFNLLDTVSENNKTLTELKGAKATVIMFICNHCPFVIHVNKTLVKLANTYQRQGVSFIAISSNDVENYPQDAPELMKVVAQREKYPFPYLYDKTQEVAKAYNAACTPDLYVFNKDLQAVYHGQLDDSRPGNGIPSTGNDISAVLEAVLTNSEVSSLQKPSIGCNIKWK